MGRSIISRIWVRRISRAALHILLIKAVQYLLVDGGPGAGGILLEMTFECQGRCAAVADIVADDTQGGDAAESGGNGNIGGVAIPKTKAFIGELFPGKEGAGIVLAGGRDVAMTDEVRGGYAVRGL